MKTIKFKTNINCAACISKITPVLNADTKINQWNVDISNPEKILTVTGENITPEEISENLNKVGYKAIEIKS